MAIEYQENINQVNREYLGQSGHLKESHISQQWACIINSLYAVFGGICGLGANVIVDPLARVIVNYAFCSRRSRQCISWTPQGLMFHS